MVQVIWAAAWGFIAPWAGRVIAWVLPTLPLDGIKRTARLAVYVTAIVAVGVGVYWLRSSLRDPVDDYVSASKVQASIERARSTALKESVTKLQTSLDERDAKVAALEDELNELRKDMELARETSPDPDVVVFPSDDPWLLQKRARQR